MTHFLNQILHTALRRWLSLSLVLRILIGMIVGIALAQLIPGASAIALIGDLFVGTLRAVAPILVAILVTHSVMRAETGLGPRFRTVIILYLFSTLMAAVVAVLFSYLMPVRLALADATPATAAGEADYALGSVFRDMLLKMVANPIEAVTQGNYLSILFWSVVMGFAFRCEAGERTCQVVDDLSRIITRVVRCVISFAPFGVMGLVFQMASQDSSAAFTSSLQLVSLLVGCMLVTALIVNPLIVALFTRSNPYPLVLLCLKESGLNAFFTRSSAANIPINMELCKKMRLDEKFYSVSIPLGATINMNGAAITISVITLAVCNTLAIEVPLTTALVLCLFSTLCACGASGVAGGSLLLLPLSCSLFGIGSNVAMSAVAIGFAISVIQDSLETALNSSGDVIFTATAERMEAANSAK